MPNKIYGAVNSDYLVEGAKDKGYLKCSGSYPGDAKSQPPITDYNENRNGPSDSWFEGNMGSKGRGEAS